MDPPPKGTKFSSPLLMTNEEIIALGIDSEQVEMFRRKEYQSRFGIETWYENLKEHTFRTEIIPLSYEEALAFLDKHYGPYAKKRVDNIKLYLDQVEARIAEALTRFPNGAFIKLNTRSPKDVPESHITELDQLDTLIQTEIEAIPEQQRTSNSVCKAWCIATNKYLKITNAKQAMELLLLSTRIAEDLAKMTSFGKQYFHCPIVIREWHDEVPRGISGEFRGFVAQNKLNALTQYFCFIHFPELVEQKDQIGKRIQAFHESIKSRIKHESYVIDFFVTPERIFVIELNPFHNGAGGALFNWREHRELFLNGPFEFRVQTDELPIDGLTLLPKKWQKYIYDERKRTARAAPIAQQPHTNMYLWWLLGAVAVGGVCFAFTQRKLT